LTELSGLRVTRRKWKVFIAQVLSTVVHKDSDPVKS